MAVSRWQAAFAIVACTTLLSAAPLRQAASSPSYLQKSRTFHSAAEFARITGGGVQMRTSVDAADELRIRRFPVHLPVNEFTVIAFESPTLAWIGSAQGAVRLNTERSTVEYFAGERWLPDDHVTGFGFESGATWIETPKGSRESTYRPMTLEEKSGRSSIASRARHNRWGFTATSDLRVPGDLTTNQPVSTDNDGLWTAMYVAAECFRYKVTGRGGRARERAAGMQAILRLEIDHRHSRVFPPARSSRSAKTCNRRTASGTTPPTRRGGGKATPARTRSSDTTSSIRSITTWWPTRRKEAVTGSARSHHDAHPRPRIPAD